MVECYTIACGLYRLVLRDGKGNYSEELNLSLLMETVRNPQGLAYDRILHRPSTRSQSCRGIGIGI